MNHNLSVDLSGAFYLNWGIHHKNSIFRLFFTAIDNFLNYALGRNVPQLLSSLKAKLLVH